MTTRMPGSNKAKHNHRTNKKEKKLKEVLINVFIPSTTKKYSISDLQSLEFIFDGGHINNPSLTPPVHKPRVKNKDKPANPPKPLKILRIAAGDLHIVDTKRSNKGLILRYPDGNVAFIRAPRKASIEMTKVDDPSVVSALCQSRDLAAAVQKNTLFRSNSGSIYLIQNMCLLDLRHVG